MVCFVPYYILQAVKQVLIFLHQKFYITSLFFGKLVRQHGKLALPGLCTAGQISLCVTLCIVIISIIVALLLISIDLSTNVHCSL